MSKKLTFTVTVEFQDKITDDLEIVEVASNIALAIQRQADNEGIAPEESETFTRSVEVTPQFVETTITREIV